MMILKMLQFFIGTVSVVVNTSRVPLIGWFCALLTALITVEGTINLMKGRPALVAPRQR
jgi:hypothetical protein